MDLKIIEVVIDKGCADTVTAIAENFSAISWYVTDVADGKREMVRIVTGNADRQKMIDQIQSALPAGQDWRIMILPMDATVPQMQEEAEDKEIQLPGRISREELFNTVERDSFLDINFITLTVLSTMVAGIGMATNNIAVVIGAMLIAPLLGPNLAFSLGAALGDYPLMKRATLTNISGLSLTILIAVGIGFIVSVPMDSPEILSRTHAGYDSIVLALAAGAAAVLSLTTGL